MDTERLVEAETGMADGSGTSGPEAAAALVAASTTSAVGPKTQDVASDDSHGHDHSHSRSRSRLSFDLLPVELQEEIWTQCLPSRIVELCPQAGLANHVISQYANPRWKYNQHPHRQPMPSRPPVVASACFAARSIALKIGRWMNGACNTPVWVDLQRDTVLLNAERLVDYALLEEDVGLADDDAIGALSPAHDHRHVPALRRHQLLSCMQQARGGVAVDADMLRSHMSRVLYPLLEGRARPPAAGSEANITVSARDADSPNGGFAGPRMVFFDDIVLVGTRAQAVRSGLFGWSPNQDTFLVRLSDTERLRQICALAECTRNQPGALRIGNIGFLRGLLQHRQEAQNRRLLEESYFAYLRNVLGWPLTPEHEAQALEQMPRLEQAVLLRFSEISASEAESRESQNRSQVHWHRA